MGVEVGAVAWEGVAILLLYIGPTGIRTSSRIPTASMSDAARASTCRSAAASTIVSALRSRAWKAGSFSRCCSSGSRGSACSTPARGSARASCSGACSRWRCGAPGLEEWLPWAAKMSTFRTPVKHMFTGHSLSRWAEPVRLARSLATAPNSRRRRRSPSRKFVRCCRKFHHISPILGICGTPERLTFQTGSSRCRGQ